MEVYSQNLWDMSRISSFSLHHSVFVSLCLTLSLCLRTRPSGACWWRQPCWLESVWARPVCVLEHNSLRVLPCFGHADSLIPLSRTFYIWNTPHLHLYSWAAQRPRSGIMNKIIISKYQQWNYPFLYVGEEEEGDTGDWEATARSCQRKLEGVCGPWSRRLINMNQSSVVWKRFSLILHFFGGDFSPAAEIPSSADHSAKH